MLRERDKKLLFYSWSYAILAASLIYACCGYGALAAYTLLYENTSTQTVTANNLVRGGTTSPVILYANFTTSNVEAITHIESEIGTHGTTGTAFSSGSYSDKLFFSTTSYIADYTATYTSFGGADGETWHLDLDISNFQHDNITALSGSGQRSINMVGFSEYLYGSDSGKLIQSHRGMTSANMLAGSGDVKYASCIQVIGYTNCGSPGNYKIYGGSATPDAPVINNFTSDATCYAPSEAIVLESNVTGTVDSWLWEIYDSSDTSVWSSTDSIETIVDENFAPGLYQVQLYVENTGGNDFLSKDNWLNVTQAGGCYSNWVNPFPTQTTVIPTQQFYETMTMPPHIVTNMSGINEEINKGLFANMSQGYRDYIDYVGEQVNTTFTGTFRTLLSPVSLVVNSIAYAIGLFSSSMSALTTYTTVPLAITAIVINYMPWQIVTLITAGIAIDAILIIILGR